MDISVFIFDGTCDSIDGGQKRSYWPIRVPDCNQTQQYYRKLRQDLDYTREHPSEKIVKCISINTGTRYSPIKINMILAFFTLLLRV